MLIYSLINLINILTILEILRYNNFPNKIFQSFRILLRRNTTNPSSLQNPSRNILSLFIIIIISQSINNTKKINFLLIHALENVFALLSSTTNRININFISLLINYTQQ